MFTLPPLPEEVMVHYIEDVSPASPLVFLPSPDDQIEFDHLVEAYNSG